MTEYNLVRGQQIAAAMIVKNEEAVLQRCLISLSRYVDYVAINDNGSTDGTPAIIESFGKRAVKVPGDWIDFATNRNLVLNVARKWGNYVLCGIDADEELVVPDGYEWPKLTADAYSLDVHLEGLVYPRTAIVRSAHPWHWRYPIQEGLYSDVPSKVEHLPGVYIRSYRGEGARAKDPDTQKKDLAVLQRYVDKHPEDPRMAFYLAQQYKDMGALGFAAQAYSERLQLGGYAAERWYSQYMLGRIDDWQGRDPTVELLKAFDMDPTRAEPLFHAADYYRKVGRNASAFALASTAAMLPMPKSGLFVERDVYEWRTLDLIATVAWYTPFKAAGREASEILLQCHVPLEHRERVAKNHEFYARM